MGFDDGLMVGLGVGFLVGPGEGLNVGLIVGARVGGGALSTRAIRVTNTSKTRSISSIMDIMTEKLLQLSLKNSQ